MGCHFNDFKRRQLERQDWTPEGGDVRGAPYDHCAELEPLSPLCVQDQASWIRAVVFGYLLVAS